MVAFALIISVFGVVCLLISETRFEEEVIDEWNPIHPSTLYPEWHGYNESDHTGVFFILRAYGNHELFRRLLDQGKISELSLDIYVNASGNVNVKVGNFIYRNETTGETFFSEIFFNTTGKLINETAKINLMGKTEKQCRAYWLEIRNVEGRSVDISGYVMLRGEMPKTFLPYYGLGTIMCLLGISLTIYGLSAKPKVKLRR